MESLIALSSAFIFAIAMALYESQRYDSFYKHLDKPGYIRIMQAICWLVSLASLLFLIVTALRSSRLLDSVIYHASISFWDVFSTAMSWALAVYMIIRFLKFQLYYISHDKKDILTGWRMNQYMQEQSSLLQERKFDDAYQYALNIAQLQPDSVFLWCNLASISEHFMNTPDKSDQHLLKAKEILDACKQPTDWDKAVFECYCGFIQQHRGNFQQGLEHMKKAYDLDPRPYRKKEYDKAVEMMNENNSDSDKPEELT
jgi:hypothetical protein